MASQKTRRTKAQIRKEEIIANLINTREKTSKNLTVNVSLETHNTLSELGVLTGKTKNELVESAINLLFWELQAQLKTKGNLELEVVEDQEE